MARAGKRGSQESVAINENLVTIGWNELPDLTSIKTREQLDEIYWKTYPDAKKMEAANHLGQIWRFINEMKKGDLVALPLKSQSAINFGEIEGEYEYSPVADNVKHIRRVKWLKTIPRTAIDQDMLYSFGAFKTVCQIQRNNAEARIKKLLKTGVVAETDKDIDESETIDIEGYANDQLTKFIARRFKGDDLARLVEAVLEAQGYMTRLSPPGPDGGIDILASAGPLGFDRPRICVQVKSTASQVDAKILRELQGVMTNVKADQGLLVSWSGFTNKALQEARDVFFTIRLWDAGALLEEIFKYYDKFDDELKAELPLKRMWALVLEEE